MPYHRTNPARSAPLARNEVAAANARAEAKIAGTERMSDALASHAANTQKPSREKAEKNTSGVGAKRVAGAGERIDKIAALKAKLASLHSVRVALGARSHQSPVVHLRQGSRSQLTGTTAMEPSRSSLAQAQSRRSGFGQVTTGFVSGSQPLAKEEADLAERLVCAQRRIRLHDQAQQAEERPERRRLRSGSCPIALAGPATLGRAETRRGGQCRPMSQKRATAD